MEVYLDNSATTKVIPEVADLVQKTMVTNYGNPSSLHGYGVKAEQNIKTVREFIKKAIGLKQGDIVFTSGGTEANNLAILGTAYRYYRYGDHLITSQVEHPSVLNVFSRLEQEGYRVTYLPVDKYGYVSLTDLREAITDDTILISIQLVNNEIGTIQPIKDIGAYLKELGHQAVFHTDAVQGVGKLLFDIDKLNVDLLTISGHKFHGPKGIGALCLTDSIDIIPITQGGGQERNLRHGTENVPGILGFGKALELSVKRWDKLKSLGELKKKFYHKLTKYLPRAEKVGPPVQEAAPHILYMAFPGIKGEVLVHALEERGVYVSTGSACSSRKKQQTSLILQALGISEDLITGGIRFSFSYLNTEQELDYAANQVIDVVRELRELREF